mgnify:CR=1 FL=1
MIKLNNSETGMINDASFLLLFWRMNADKKRLSNYTKKNYYIIICDEENLCPDCERKMKIIGSRKRTVKDISGEEYIFSLRRMRCEECHIIHTEIPNCMIPHKQYSKEYNFSMEKAKHTRLAMTTNEVLDIMHCGGTT